MDRLERLSMDDLDVIIGICIDLNNPKHIGEPDKTLLELINVKQQRNAEDY